VILDKKKRLIREAFFHYYFDSIVGDGFGVGVCIGSGPGGVTPGDGETDGDGFGIGVVVGIGVGVGLSTAKLVPDLPPPAETAIVPATKNIKRTIDKQKRPAALFRSKGTNFILTLRVRFCRFYYYDMKIHPGDVNLLINYSRFERAFDLFQYLKSLLR
jgi:hypothetical protein